MDLKCTFNLHIADILTNYEYEKTHSLQKIPTDWSYLSLYIKTFF